jgi:hypothetical protein
MISLAWLLGLGTGFVSVFSGIYSTDTLLSTAYSNPHHCSFKVIFLFQKISSITIVFV